MEEVDAPLWFKLKMAPDGRTGFLWISESPKTRRFMGVVKVGYCQKIDEGYETIGTLEAKKS
jgi:hypothetical protein